jgi:hypothetical protein
MTGGESKYAFVLVNHYRLFFLLHLHVSYYYYYFALNLTITMSFFCCHAESSKQQKKKKETVIKEKTNDCSKEIKVTVALYVCGHTIP